MVAELLRHLQDILQQSPIYRYELEEHAYFLEEDDVIHVYTQHHVLNRKVAEALEDE